MRFTSKTNAIESLCAGKRVLHLGCVGFADSSPGERIALARKSLHYKLTNIADVTGVDSCGDAIEYFRNKGTFDNVLHGDVERLSEIGLSGHFDIVVAGDIIEHLSNPGRFLDELRTVIDRETVVVITTPNSFGVSAFIRNSIGTFREGGEHVMTFNSQNLVNLFVRHGFEVISVDTCYQPQAEEAGGVFFQLGKMALKVCPSLGGTLIAVARLR